MEKSNLFAVAAVLAVVGVGMLYAKPVTVNVDAGQSVMQQPGATEQPLTFGGAAGPTHTEQQFFLDGVVYSTLVATSSQGDQTVTAAEFRQWVKAGLVEYTPNLAAGATVTLPASSTMPDVLPKAGDRTRVCIRNATTTANTNITLAGGTGMTLMVASSTATAVGSPVIGTGKIGCFDLIRETATATTFDLDALFTVFK